MNSTNLKTLIDEQDQDQLYRFYRTQLWMDEDSLDEKYLHYIAPFSDVYYSPMRSIFSFEIKKIEHLSYFDFVSFRDGLLQLMRFFNLFPTPGAVPTRIFIEKSLLPVVPLAWQNQVSSYELVQKNIEAERSKILLLGLLDKAQLSLSELERELDKLGPMTGKEINLCLFNHPYRGEDSIEGMSSHDFKIAKKLFSTLGEKLKIVTWDEVKKLNMQDFLFHDFNPRKFLYSDSFVDHSLLSRGAVKFGVRSYEAEPTVALSSSHGYLLDRPNWSQYEKITTKIDDERRDLEEMFLRSERAISRDDEDYQKVRLCSDSFLSFAMNVSEWINE